MNEDISNLPVIDPTQLAETAATLDTEKFRTEISSPGGTLAFAEATESQVNPVVERMKRAEKAFFGSPDSLIKQIDEGELGVDDTDFEDRTAVMMMTARGHAGAVKELIARNADVNRINMYQGRIPMSALDAARQTNRKNIEQLLLDNGAKSGRELYAEQIAVEQNEK